MKVSVIVAVYNDLEALQLIVSAMRSQTYTNFELVVAEDAQHESIRGYIDTINDIEIVHTTQEDCGIRKSRSQNNGIIACNGSYLIFIDGDCIPYSTFVEGHVKLSEAGTIVTARRVNLGYEVSRSIRTGVLDPAKLERTYLQHIARLRLDGATHIEHGVHISPDGFLYRALFRKINRSTNILGCNFSCHKDDIVAINGFDESYEGTALGDDTDLQWRFEAYGAKFKSANNVANMFHLYHTREHRNVDYTSAISLMNKRQEQQQFFCTPGIIEHHSS